MLCYQNDAPTIRHAIMRRLEKEPGVAIADLVIKEVKKGDKITRTGVELEAQDDHIAVGVWIIIMDRVQDEGLIDARSFFDLKPQFELRQVHNEVDEIAEQIKAARRQAGVGRLLWRPGMERERHDVLGTGRRGRWSVRQPNDAEAHANR